MTPDWSQAPEGATHYNVRDLCWYRFRFGAFKRWYGGKWISVPCTDGINDFHNFLERSE